MCSFIFSPKISNILLKQTNGVEASIRKPIANRKSPILKFWLYDTGIPNSGMIIWCTKIRFFELANLCNKVWLKIEKKCKYYIPSHFNECFEFQNIILHFEEKVIAYKLPRILFGVIFVILFPEGQEHCNNIIKEVRNT